ncbi:2OG-Fe(II) oxygenase [Parahaliea mediterranea]|uniref:2OG-Fe(II) oxygenase n=1 Tax=Parahaliea mediterranea TaxID=651086 RepID=A0A939IK41_9GAMM|nr:2OG-Fe(II) oxygenase [Parahaliea mediterranea]MBN7795060.1 2OG-Fe(II) oxygenase [Parahaliea mediterranea]
MQTPAPQSPVSATPQDDGALFDRIADALRERGYAVCPNALPPALCAALLAQLQAMNSADFSRAGVGREEDWTLNNFVRSDAICWITGASPAGGDWLDWASRLRQHLNRQLLLGLFSFESHFAHYRPGDFYRKHLDAFRGDTNRVLSVVAYLNPDWQAPDGGELLMYLDAEGGNTLKVLPGLGTVVVFLSEEFPHEVLPARRDRYSIAGWYRVNTSRGDRIDPPQ